MAGRKVKLFLTCRLRTEDNPGSYRAGPAADLVGQLEIAESVVELGAAPYASLHHLYRQCSLYVTPAYAESFAHPLVEAMASGLPVVAADTAVHREICQDAAVYFPRFSPEELATQVCHIAASDRLVENSHSEDGSARASSPGEGMLRSCWLWLRIYSLPAKACWAFGQLQSAMFQSEACGLG